MHHREGIHPPRQGEPVWAGAVRAFPLAHASSPRPRAVSYPGDGGGLSGLAAVFIGGDRGKAGSHASVTVEEKVSALEMDQMVITAAMEVRMETRWGPRGEGEEAVSVGAARWAGATLPVPERWPAPPRRAAPPPQTSGSTHLRATPPILGKCPRPPQRTALPTLEEWPRPPHEERPRPPWKGGPTPSDRAVTSTSERYYI